jgi:hypothetical protein
VGATEPAPAKIGGEEDRGRGGKPQLAAIPELPEFAQVGVDRAGGVALQRGRFEGYALRAARSLGVDGRGFCKRWGACAVPYHAGLGSKFLGVRAGKRVWWAVTHLGKGTICQLVGARRESKARKLRVYCFSKLVSQSLEFAL